MPPKPKSSPYRFEQVEVDGVIKHTLFFRDGTSETTAFKASLGNVLVAPADEPNPYTYRGPYSCGSPRATMLRRFHTGENTEGFVLWYAPVSGGAMRITAACVEWGGL